MLLIIRIIITLLFGITICVAGSIWCLFSPRNPRHVATFAQLFARLAPVLGVRVETRKPASASQFGNAIYIANHQSNYDLLLAGDVVQSPTVTIGKKSLMWVPFFGILYWLTGNLLIDRNNHARAYSTINEVVAQFKKRTISFWMFPEGTRSKGRGLLPFKNGAFHAAIVAGVPIIPVCISNTYNQIHLNRRNNGYVIVEMLEPIDPSQWKKDQIRDFSRYCHQLMEQKIAELNRQVAEKEMKQ